jgi:hypothetical protein
MKPTMRGLAAALLDKGLITFDSSLRIEMFPLDAQKMISQQLVVTNPPRSSHQDHASRT